MAAAAAAQVYGGDEINALVLDPGAYTTRAGWAGEDNPKCVVPSVVGVINGGYAAKQEATEQQNGLSTASPAAATATVGTGIEPRRCIVGDPAVHARIPGMEMASYMRDGMVDNWEMTEQVWSYALGSRLRASPDQNPLLITEPAWNTRDNRAKTAELAFEKFNVPAFYLAKQPVCAAFAMAKSTALVVDLGAQTASVTPVYDGLVLKKATFHQMLAGNNISAFVRDYLSSPGRNIIPHYLVSRRGISSEPGMLPSNVVLHERETLGVTESWHRFQQDRVLDSFKETMLQVSETPMDEQNSSSVNYLGKIFEFPDGYQELYGKLRYSLAEPLFQPNLLRRLPTQAPYLSLPNLVQQSLEACDPDLRSPLLGNILVTGGTSLIQGLNDRLNIEISKANPGSKVRVQASGNTTERIFGKWIGGSILASLGTFHQLWISKQEYEENGDIGQLLEKRCK